MVKNLAAKIESKYAGDRVPRQHLGLSEIGHQCPRYLWYAHKGTPAIPPEGRVLRLFRLGEMIEDGVINDLHKIGWDVTDRQREVEITDHGITLKGHIDGIVDDHLLEIKSANDKSFKEFMAKGYEHNKKYKAQLHTYMVLLDINKAIAIVENKNDSNLYIEEIKLDRDYVTKLLIDVFAAITSEEAPARMCPNQSWFEAKWCPLREVCFETTP